MDCSVLKAKLSSGNIYVTGFTSGGLDGNTNGGAGIFLVKYDSSGNLQ